MVMVISHRGQTLCKGGRGNIIQVGDEIGSIEHTHRYFGNTIITTASTVTDYCYYYHTKICLSAFLLLLLMLGDTANMMATALLH